jgi:hypothetical protein
MRVRGDAMLVSHHLELCGIVGGRCELASVSKNILSKGASELSFDLKTTRNPNVQPMAHYFYLW